MHFARVLRSAGMPVGTDRMQLALQALQHRRPREPQRLSRRACAPACSTASNTSDLFDQAFELFWRDPDLLGRMRAMLLPKVRAQQALTPEQRENRRLGEALFPNPKSDAQQPTARRVDRARRCAHRQRRELLRKADFDTMSADEWRAARRALALMRWVFEPLPTRRAERSPRAGRVDWRATLQTMARHGGELGEMRWRRPRTLPAPMVVLADISGSMSRYSRMLLHFAHALAACRGACRELRVRHAAHAHHAAAAAARPRRRGGAGGEARWKTGRAARASPPACTSSTSAGRAACSSSRATVLLISDGLEHGDTARAVARDGAPGQELPPADLAQPAAALRRLRAARRPASARCCRTSTASCRRTTSTASSTWCACSATPDVPARSTPTSHRITTMQLTNQQTLPVTQATGLGGAERHRRCCRRRSPAANRSRRAATTSTKWRSPPPWAR